VDLNQLDPINQDPEVSALEGLSSIDFSTSGRSESFIHQIATEPVEATSGVCAPSEDDLVKTDSKGRLRVSKEQRKAVLARFEQSGMSAA
jgi:hypothetical protein